MAYAIVHHFPGGTKEQYEKSLAAVHPSRSSLPAGQIFHASGPLGGGWTIMAVHDSKESWERFRDQILMPRMKQGIEGVGSGCELEPECRQPGVFLIPRFYSPIRIRAQDLGIDYRRLGFARYVLNLPEQKFSEQRVHLLTLLPLHKFCEQRVPGLLI